MKLREFFNLRGRPECLENLKIYSLSHSESDHKIDKHSYTVSFATPGSLGQHHPDVLSKRSGSRRLERSEAQPSFLTLSNPFIRYFTFPTFLNTTQSLLHLILVSCPHEIQEPRRAPQGQRREAARSAAEGGSLLDLDSIDAKTHFF